MCLQCFDTVGLRQEEHSACKNSHKVLMSAARCKWLAYGPADATAIPSSLASVKSRTVCPCGILSCLGWQSANFLMEYRSVEMEHRSVEMEHWLQLASTMVLWTFLELVCYFSITIVPVNYCSGKEWISEDWRLCCCMPIFVLMFWSGSSICWYQYVCSRYCYVIVDNFVEEW